MSLACCDSVYDVLLRLSHPSLHTVTLGSEGMLPTELNAQSTLQIESDLILFAMLIGHLAQLATAATVINIFDWKSHGAYGIMSKVEQSGLPSNLQPFTQPFSVFAGLITNRVLESILAIASLEKALSLSSLSHILQPVPTCLI